MRGKELRMSKLFNAESGNAVIIPVDHGLVMGSLEGLTDPVSVLKKLVESGIDATLMSPGLAKMTANLFVGKNSPARILTVDLPLISSVPGEFEDVVSHKRVSSVEYALKWGFDAVKVLFPWGLEREIQAQSISVVAEFVAECDRWEVPLMVEPVLWGNLIPKERKKDSNLIESAARIAMEIGADIIKMPYTGDKEEFSKIVSNLHVPVVVLGGPRMESIIDVLGVARDSIDAGAKGIVFGRNVWQYPRVSDLVSALNEIVHGNLEVSVVVQKYNLS